MICDTKSLRPSPWMQFVARRCALAWIWARHDWLGLRTTKSHAWNKFLLTEKIPRLVVRYVGPKKDTGTARGLLNADYCKIPHYIAINLRFALSAPSNIPQP